MFDLDEVYFVGTLDTSFCGSDVIVRPETPTSVDVGLPCFDVGFALRNDGSMVYLYTDDIGNSHLATFVADAFQRTDGGSWSYPSNPESNDTILLTQDCDANGGPSGFVLDPETGEVIHNCPGSNDWVDSTGAVRVPNAVPLSLGYNGTALIFSGANLAVLDNSGQSHVVATLPAPPSASYDTTRPLTDGWWEVIEDSSGRNLWHIDFAGNALQVGSYPAFTEADLTSALTSTGDLYIFGTDPADASGQSFTIARLGLNGAVTVVYTEFGAPADDLSVTPPQVFARVGTRGGRLFSVH